MAVGLSGWAQNRATREGRGARVESHAEVQRAEAALRNRQAALRLAMASSAEDIETLLASMAEAEDALLVARRAWARAAGVAIEAPKPVRAPQVTFSFDRSSKRTRRAPAPRPSFTYGSWV